MSLDPNNPLTPRTNEAEKRLQQQEVKNIVINGGFDFWQRGDTFATAADIYTADRWFAGDNAGSAGYRVDQNINVPTESRSKYCLKAEVTASTTLAANDALRIQHGVEGNFFKHLHQKSVIFEFWVKSSVAGVYPFVIVTALGVSSRKAYATEYTIDTADTWEKKSIEIDFTPLIEDTNIYLDNQKAFDIIWGLGSGSSRTAPSNDSWIDAPTLYGATSGSIDWQSQGIGTEFYLSDVIAYDAKSGVGVEFERAGRNYQEELQLCQRYFEKSYFLTTPPGTATFLGMTRGASHGPANALAAANTSFKVEKRVIPTMVNYDEDGLNNSIWSSGGSIPGATGFTAVNLNNFYFTNGSGALSDNEQFGFQWTADAEL